MSRSNGTRNSPDIAKCTMSTVQEASSSKLTKRSRSLPAAPKETCWALPDKTSMKDQLSQNDSPTRNNVRGRAAQCGHSHKQNGSTKKISSDPKGKLADSPEFEQNSKKGNQRSDNHVVTSDTSDPVFYDATNGFASTAAHQEAKVYSLGAQYAKLCIRSIRSDDGSTERGPIMPAVLIMNSSSEHGAISSAGMKLSKVTEADVLPAVVSDGPLSGEPLLLELKEDIIGRLPMQQVMQLRSELGKALRNAILRPAFVRNRPDWEGEFSPSFFKTDDRGDLHWHGFDTRLRKWTRLPSLNFAKMILPSPNPDLFKDYLVAGDGGLLCINVGKASGREKLVVCNPLTQQVKVLPPLNYPRHPVLMHLKVDHESGHYKIFVVGSAAIGTEELSLKTEEYDSRKGVWECPDGSDLPCQPFGLNEYQNGVYVQDSERELLMCVAIVDTRGRGVLVYDITKKKWAQGPHVKQLHIPLVRSEPNVSHLATTQIVECGGSVFVFSEQECGRDVYFLIHKLIPDISGDFIWDEVMKRKRTGGRGLLVYPEFTCVPVSEHELCIFNTVEHTIEIIDLATPTDLTLLQVAPTSSGNRFHSLNPIGFVFRPSFRSVVCPRGRNPELRCDLNLGEYCSECESRESSESFLRNGRRAMNVCSKVINGSGCVEEASPYVDTAPTQKTHMSADPVETDMSTDAVESGGSEKSMDFPKKSCGWADEEKRKRRNSGDGADMKIVY